MSLDESQVEKVTKPKGAEKMLELFLFMTTSFGGNSLFSVNAVSFTFYQYAQ